ncbi:MAG: hypothetical protein WC237_01555 [Candidatus Paceibacterota bacterium]|jgi:antitoxin component of RelBE/YafQ-DinJ toxin-antitoxin module
MMSVKIEKTLKDQALNLAHDLGVSLNAVINGFIKEFISERKVTFADHPMPNAKTRKVLDELLADSKENKNFVGPFDSAKEAIGYLHSKRS